MENCSNAVLWCRLGQVLLWLPWWWWQLILFFWPSSALWADIHNWWRHWLLP